MIVSLNFTLVEWLGGQDYLRYMIDAKEFNRRVTTSMYGGYLLLEEFTYDVAEQRSVAFLSRVEEYGIDRKVLSYVRLEGRGTIWQMYEGENMLRTRIEEVLGVHLP